MNGVFWLGVLVGVGMGFLLLAGAMMLGVLLLRGAGRGVWR